LDLNRMARDNAARLYLVIEAGTDPRDLAPLLDAAEPAAVLVAAPEGGRLDVADVRPLVEMAQAKSIAALIEADAQLARTLRADGVHLPWSRDVVARFGEAREVLGGRYIIGADAGRSRHDAMTLGEAGADYVGFGIPEHVEDRNTARERRLDLVAWWSEIFELPGIAFDVETADDAAELARAGADFVAVRVPASLAVAERAAWLQKVQWAVAEPEGVA
jgi:thiamine-phosphate pyrophosphorylase